MTPVSRLALAFVIAAFSTALLDPVAAVALDGDPMTDAAARPGGFRHAGGNGFPERAGVGQLDDLEVVVCQNSADANAECWQKLRVDGRALGNEAAQAP